MKEDKIKEEKNENICDIFSLKIFIKKLKNLISKYYITFLFFLI